MRRDFAPVLADDHLQRAVCRLIDLGSDEDLRDVGDATTLATVPASLVGRCRVVARQPGIAAGLITVPWVLETLNADVTFQPTHSDGHPFAAGDCLGILAGNARDILSAERLILNLVSRLCGVATLTARYVAEIADFPTRLYDTRKTTVGWRLPEKYAVRCGGGHNHRTGLFDAILIKDNHLALAGQALEELPNQPPGTQSPGTDADKETTQRQTGPGGAGQGSAPALTPGEAIERARAWRRHQGGPAEHMPIEVEVDSLTQMRDAFSAKPDIILLDNFSLEELRTAVTERDAQFPHVELEASGGVTVDTIAAIANTGVDRISCGAITHQATWLDLGLDWMA